MKSHLEASDPYLSVIEDHRLALVAGLSLPTMIVTSQGADESGHDTKLLGYSLLSPASRPGPPPALDIIVTLEQEDEATRALLGAARETHKTFTWWAREPRSKTFEDILQERDATAHRRVMRMERPIDTPLTDIASTRPATINDIDEIVRINNEAFTEHPDRHDLDRLAIEHDITITGNHVKDILLTDGAFCWTKRLENNESEIFVLAIGRAQQGHGLGGRLLRSGLEHVRMHHNARRAYLYVEHTNTRAISLYERNGFRDSHHSLVSATFTSPVRHSHQ